MKVLVTAAGGNQGKEILPRFRAAGFRVRAVRATDGRDAELIERGAEEVCVGDATDRKFLRGVMAGIDAVYHVGPTAHPQEREMGFAVIDAAREAGVGHFVYSSVLHPIASFMVQHKLKRDVEEHLLESNMPFTVLQPADYMLPNVFGAALRSGVWQQLYDLERGQAMVALSDVAEVAARIVGEGTAHHGATYQLCAPGVPSGNDIAAAMLAVTGRQVKAEIIDADRYFELFYEVGSGDRFRYEHAVIRSVAQWYHQYTFAGCPNVLRWLLGREPKTLEQYIAEQWQAEHDAG